jgi:hypothetical protein
MRLFIDDERIPPSDDYVVVRSSQEAIEHIKTYGWPTFISFDHDLGGDDTTMVFLKRLMNEIWDGKTNPPDYQIHSANPIGKLNIQSFMESWKKII